MKAPKLSCHGVGDSNTPREIFGPSSHTIPNEASSTSLSWVALNRAINVKLEVAPGGGGGGWANVFPKGMKHRSIPKNVEKCFCGGFTKGACAFIQEKFFFFYRSSFVGRHLCQAS